MSFPINYIKNSRLNLPFSSAILLVLSQPPISLFPLAYVALIPLLFSLETGKHRRNFFAGFLTGIMAYTGLVYWVVVAMNTYGGISIPLAILILALFVLYLALYVGLVTWLCPWLEVSLRVPLYLGVPLLWVLCEYWRGWFLSGFPWSYLAHSQHNFLAMIQVVSVTGTYFVSFFIVAINFIIFSLFRRKPVPLFYTLLIAVLVVASLVFGYARLRDKVDGTLKTAIIQGNILQDVKWDEAFKLNTLDVYSRLTLGEGRGVNLVIWPETAMPFVFDADPARSVVTALPEMLSTHLLFGTLFRDDRSRFYNSAYIFGKKGQIVGRYDKVHLVPFGEFTPLRDYFPFLEKISVATGDFFSGGGHSPISTELGKVGLLICYEGTFPCITIDTVRRGAQVLVNITNDAWFGRSSAPYQHLAFYTFRAIETDRFVLRAANTGVSAIIDPRGRIIARTDIFIRTVLKGTFSMRDGQTFYVRYGDYFVALCLITLVGLIVRGLVGKKNRQ
ncbi:MAG: apolipoprotein N-acyltransferase [Syntrophorhabdales bacterium]|jgi:apolipoprotein N-acyltransferase